MKDKKSFGIYLTKDFERRYCLNCAECVVKCTSFGHSRYDTYRKGEITIENKCEINLFAKIKVYSYNNESYIFSKNFNLGTCQVRSVFTFTSREHGSGPFICCVKYEKLPKISDKDETNDARNEENSKGPTIESRLNNLSLDMERLLEQGKFSDVILSDGSNDIQVHKLVLSTRSPVFAKMFEHPMKENRENRVIISDISLKIIKEMLKFMYTGVVAFEDQKMVRDLYIAADKYDIKELRDVCAKHLKNVDLNSVLDTLTLAHLYEDKILKQSALDFIAANYSQVKKHERWGSFGKKYKDLAIEVLSFVLDKRI